MGSLIDQILRRHRRLSVPLCLLVDSMELKTPSRNQWIFRCKVKKNIKIIETVVSIGLSWVVRKTTYWKGTPPRYIPSRPTCFQASGSQKLPMPSLAATKRADRLPSSPNRRRTRGHRAIAPTDLSRRRALTRFRAWTK